MSIQLKGVVVASAVASLIVSSASGAAAQTASKSIEPKPVPMLEVPVRPGETSGMRLRLMAGQVNPHPINEPVPGGPIPLPADIDDYVMAAAGKLHIKIGEVPHYCSAVFIAEDVIVTAAHCVQKNGTNEKYEVTGFQRAVGGNPILLHGPCTNQNGASPVKVPAEWALVSDEYLRINYDYAFLKLESGVADLNVQFKEMDPYGKTVTAVGYPATHDPELVGIRELAVQDALHPEPMYLTTESLGFTEGTSGGAWVWKPGMGNGPRKVVSVNSSYAVPIYDKSFIRLYGPNFSRARKSAQETEPSALLGEAKGCSS